MCGTSETVYFPTVNFLLAIEGQVVAFDKPGEVETTVTHLLPL